MNDTPTTVSAPSVTSNTSPKRRVLEAAVILAITFATGAIGSHVTIPNIPTWYEGLSKPFFNPPNWIFGPVWTVLYLAMSYAAWRVLARSPNHAATRLIALAYGVQLFFNALWSIVFFGLMNPLWGLLVVAFLEASVIAMVLVFARFDRFAAASQLPYVAWVAFASLLNLAIVLLN